MRSYGMCKKIVACFVLLFGTSLLLQGKDNACIVPEPGSTGAKLVVNGEYEGHKTDFSCVFDKDPSRYEKKYAGLKSSKGGHSYQLVCYAPDGKNVLKFWLMGITSPGLIYGLNSARDSSKTPYVTLHFGDKNKPLKEKAQNKENREIKVNLIEYKLDQEKGEARIVGCLAADWGASGKVEASFNVLIKDIGLTVK